MVSYELWYLLIFPTPRGVCVLDIYVAIVGELVPAQCRPGVTHSRRERCVHSWCVVVYGMPPAVVVNLLAPRCALIGFGVRILFLFLTPTSVYMRGTPPPYIGSTLGGDRSK
jgi:hypothetical protein